MPLYPAAPSPKRKRDEKPHSPQQRVTSRRLYTLPEKLMSSSGEDIETGVETPRSRVAHSFGELQIEGTGGVSRLDLLGTFGASSKVDNGESRKQVKSAQNGLKEIPETPQVSSNIVSGPAGAIRFDMKAAFGSQQNNIIFTGANSTSTPTTLTTTLPSRPSHKLPASPPSPDPPPQQFSPAPSPPVTPMTSPSQEPPSLHWEESEITGHNPSDPDDDGEGINGVGFKPTAAIARARSERRRKQLADYKSREDKEARDARAKRAALRRRKGSEGVAVKTEESQVSEKERRVRFSEAERAIDVL
ncbi:hypothetical protein VE01_08407 [Pseudogymnoascus verrucosus]|uniref:Uncharacterized protein n=1 Tax=Pseudogymnoascus verrucosus TaxID=342668 RepID=A0A1B8GBR9_9PEZI|nr:uncharacterized protein VE01_08407 [Pseudogymnoascus verrucosus]OBT93276.1 hypothetical protein VE01_08407 [Pseudogymnoascus verrucosus]